MKTIRIRLACAVCAASLLMGASSLFAQAERRALPAPQTEGGMPLMEALKARRSQRAYSARKLSDQMLANLLWAADGINRDDGRRTAPSAMNWQEVDVYVTTAEGCYLYDAKAKDLAVISTEDARALTGMQPFVKDAPLNLVYVADYARITGGSEESKLSNSSADVGFISQNVYLFCASEGLATVVRGGVNRVPLAKSLKLRPEQKIVLAQTVGYPAE